MSVMLAHPHGHVCGSPGRRLRQFDMQDVFKEGDLDKRLMQGREESSIV